MGENMGFIKKVEIYSGKNCKVTINQCHNKGKKTKSFAIRRDGKYFGQFIGEIKFNPRWRQYCFYPEPDTVWSSSCLVGIQFFCWQQTEKWRRK